MPEAALYGLGFAVDVAVVIEADVESRVGATVEVAASSTPRGGSGPCMAGDGGIIVSYRTGTGKQQPKRCLETRLAVMGVPLAVRRQLKESWQAP